MIIIQLIVFIIDVNDVKSKSIVKNDNIGVQPIRLKSNKKNVEEKEECGC
jgi:hypothetical protein